VAAKLKDYILKPEGRHVVTVWLAILFYLLVIVWVTLYGFGFYRLPLEQRAFHPLNHQLRPSGPIGIRLAFLGVASFFGIYLYAIRKHWGWLGQLGKTRNWLNVHVVMGTAAPVLITFHAAFRTRGLAGTAYWIMMIVVLSGFVGRYLYAQVPRRLNAAELSLNDMQTVTADLTEQLQSQNLFSAEDLKPLLSVPGKQEVERLSVPAALLFMLSCDFKRPFRVARLRRRTLTGFERFRSLWGLLPSSHADLETIIELARKRSWMATKIAFLSKTREVFHLWHVVHRPFSYSFALLACVHIGFALFIGYY
jgi:hypothetical protein